jgi:hypothetical protein
MVLENQSHGEPAQRHVMNERSTTLASSLMYLLLTYCLPVNLAFLSVEAAAAAAAAAPPQPTHGGRPWLGHWLAWTLLSASSIRHAPSQAIDRSSLFLFSSFGRSKTCEFQTAC